MPPDASLRAPGAAALVEAIPQAWRIPLLQVGLAAAALFALTWGDWADMADQWWNASTYNHALLIPLVIGWLVWQRKSELARLVPCAWWPGLVVLAGALFLWLLGSVSGLNLARQIGAVMALQGAVLTLLGPRVASGVLFVLLYALFLVPFGDELVPFLQMVTARITIALTQLSGIKADIEGVFIDTPAGLFEVAEACSGVKFLVAMIALGALAAHVCFVSVWRRTLFMAAAIIVPILANGVRAWGTIFIAQSQGLDFAAGFDHIFYGWIFFAIVLALVLGLAWRFFDRSPEGQFIDADAIAANRLLARLDRFALPAWPTLGAVALLAAAFGAWAAGASRVEAPLPDRIVLPEVPGWHQASYQPQTWWEPRASGAAHRLLGRYKDGQGHQVDVFLALYSAQGEGREAGGFGEGALPPDSAWSWLEFAPAMDSARTDQLVADGDLQRFAATFYRHGDLLTGSNTRLKLAVMRDRLLLHEQPTMLLILSGEERLGPSAGDSITVFRAATGETGAWMDRIAKGS